MKAYTLHYFWHDLISGQYMIEFSFGLPQAQTQEKIRFVKSESEGKEYLEGDKSHWFKVCVEFVVNQATKITENQMDQARERSMQLCNGFYNSVAERSVPLKELCSRFMHGQKHFLRIIQHSGEESSLLHCVNEITKFCQQELR